MSADDAMSELVDLTVTSLRTAAEWSVALGVMTKEQFVRWAGDAFDRAEARADRPTPAVIPPGFEPVQGDTINFTVKSLTSHPCVHGCSLFRRYDEAHDAYYFLWSCGATSRLAAAVFEIPRL